jgi:hypothetical protein
MVTRTLVFDNDISFMTTTTTSVPMPAVQKELLTKLHIPAWFWMSKNQVASGFFYANSVPSATPNGPLQHTSIFRLLVKCFRTPISASQQQPSPSESYTWQRLAFVTHWSSPTHVTLFCFDLPPGLEVSIQQSLPNGNPETLSNHPYAIHAFLLDHITTLFDAAIWQLRDMVRLRELRRPTLSHPATATNYTYLHELARHTTHSTEVCNTALNVIDSMLEDIRSLSPSSFFPTTASTTILPDILRQKSLLTSYHLRSQALEARLKNEIGLAFHIAAQHESVLAQQIAQSAKEDSRAMKTISVLGLVFLPGTFVSVSFSHLPLRARIIC